MFGSNVLGEARRAGGTRWTRVTALATTEGLEDGQLAFIGPAPLAPRTLIPLPSSPSRAAGESVSISLSGREYRA